MKTQVAAIDFGTSKVVTLIAQSGGVNRCDIIGSGTVPYDGFAQGDWNTPEQLARVALLVDCLLYTSGAADE